MKGYQPYKVIEGDELLVKDDNGNLWAGEWQRNQMNQPSKINIGHYHDPIRGPREPAGMPVDQLYRHLLVTGVTGYGKSTVLRNIQLQLAEQGYGIFFLDPKGEDGRKLLKQLPEHRTDDIVYVAPGDQRDESVHMNLLSVSDDASADEAGAIVDSILRVFKNGIDSWDSRLYRAVKDPLECILTMLVESEKEYTLMDVIPILDDNNEQDAFTEQYEDELAKRDRFPTDLNEELDDIDDAVIDELKGFLRRLAGNRVVRETLMDRDAVFSLKTAIEDEKIIVLNTSNINSSDVKNTIQRFLLSKLWHIKRECVKSVSYFVFLDEFDKIVDENFEMNDILSMARGYNIGFTVSFQQFSQLPDNTATTCRGIAHPLSLNPGTNASDASSVAQLHNVGGGQMSELEPFSAMFSPVSSDGHIADEAFEVSLFGPLPPKRDNIENIISASLHKYGRPNGSVETDIESYRV